MQRKAALVRCNLFRSLWPPGPAQASLQQVRDGCPPQDGQSLYPTCHSCISSNDPDVYRAPYPTVAPHGNTVGLVPGDPFRGEGNTCLCRTLPHVTQMLFIPLLQELGSKGLRRTHMYSWLGPGPGLDSRTPGSTHVPLWPLQ